MVHGLPSSREYKAAVQRSCAAQRHGDKCEGACLADMFLDADTRPVLTYSLLMGDTECPQPISLDV